MTYRIPPLNALRAFEAAARHLSFKLAGAELNVTPGAVSQQVKALEDTLGVKLFERVHNGLLLTEEGQGYLAPLCLAFTTISSATETISPRHGARTLTVGCDGAFAVHWLVPKMAEFRRVHPEIRVRIGEADDPEAVVSGRVGVALLKGVTSHPGLSCRLLVEEQHSPLCAPERLEEIKSAFDTLPLLIAGDEATWHRWLQHSARGRLADFTSVAFEERSLAVYGAIAGRGCVMGSSLWDAAEVGSGRLVRAFDSAVTSGVAYYAVTAAGRSACPAEKAFIDWLLEQGETETQMSPAAE